MDVKISEEAEKQLEDLETKHEKKILESIEEVAQKGFGQNTSTKVIRDPEYGEIWRLKVKEGSRGGLDHRVFLDYDNGSLIVLSVMHRDSAYRE